MIGEAEYAGGRGIRLLAPVRALTSTAALAFLLASGFAQDTQQPSTPSSNSQQNPQAGSDQAPQTSSGQSSQNPPQQTSPSTQNPPQQPPPSENQQKKEESGNALQVVTGMSTKLAQAGFTKVRDWEEGLITGTYVGKERRLVPLNTRQRRALYLQQTLASPSAYWKRMFQAAVDQARDAPPQWGGGWGGYGKRFASREGQFIAANSFAAWGNEKLGYEPRYEQCRCDGLRARLKHAIARNFYTYDRTEADKHPQWALYGGALGGGLLSAAWKPDHNPLKDGLYGVLGQAAYGTLLNVAIEFSRDINRKLGSKK
jgi:hypothetical protein